jgi:hypothetical protein
MAESWIKVHTDMLCDPKILRLHPVSRYAWVGLLLLARTGSPPGTWKAVSRDSAAEDLEVALGLNNYLNDEAARRPLLNGDFERMVDCGLVSVSESGLVTVLHWSQRQGRLNPSDTPERTRQRKQAQRDRQRHDMSRASTTEEKRREESRGDLTTTTLGQQQPAGRASAITKTPPNPQGQRPQSLASGFERFWRVYPRKVKRRKALEAWLKVRPDADLTIRIIAAVEAAKRSRDWQKDRGRYIPHPTSWLNQGRWDDETETEQNDPDRLPSVAEIMRGGS